MSRSGSRGSLVFSSCNLVVVCCSNATISRSRSERESGNLLSSHCQGKRASGETHRIQILFTTLFKTSTVRPGVRRPAGRGGTVLSAHLAVITPSVSSGAQWCRTPHTYSKYLTSNSRVFAHDVAGGIPLRCRCLRQIYYVRIFDGINGSVATFARETRESPRVRREKTRVDVAIIAKLSFVRSLTPNLKNDLLQST